MAEHPSIPAVSISPPGGRRRWNATLLLLLISGPWLAWSAYQRITLRPTPRTEYWLAQLKAVEPLGPQAISSDQAGRLLGACPRAIVPASGPTPAAAIRFVAASDPSGRMLSPQGRSDTYYLYEILRGDWDESRPDIRSVGQLFSSAEFKRSREALKKAVQLGWWDETPNQPASVRFDSYVQYKEWAYCLLAHSRWAREHEHDTETMVEDWLTAFGLALQVRRSHSPLAHPIASETTRQVAVEIGLTAGENPGIVASAALTRDVDAILLPAALPGRVAQAVWIQARDRIDRYFVREGGDWIDVSEFATGRETELYAWRVKARAGQRHSRWLNLASPLFHDYPTACRNANQLAAELVSLVDLRACHTHDLARNRGLRSAPDVLDGQSRNARQDAVWTMTMAYSSAMEVDTGLTMLALEQFRLAKGRYPQQLADLIPHYLPRLPVDYADRGVLRYRLKGEHYTLYSIGPDGIDDRGQTRGRHSRDPLEVEGDLVLGTYSRAERYSQWPR
ncbi:MAG TPA: hypothetical protein PKY77_14635 [Phycisphaerae bacterium]|nr:hypothetical protein [Phycisphaerae bacterium]HRY67492.1 hypothetical protein [Phycisphaerae bacterium]HSA27915.1 hypothetical protein [Phycisphaerae bacterium]